MSKELKTIVQRDDLLRALRDVKPAVSRTATLPVLSNVLLTKAGKALTIAASNLDLVIVTQVAATGRGKWSLSVPMVTLLDLVDLLPSESVTLVFEEARQILQVLCEGVKATLKGIDGAEFPILPSPGKSCWLEMPGAEWGQMARQVGAMAATDGARPTLSGMKMAVGEDGRLELAATDGFRLARLVRPGVAAAAQSVIIPGQPLAEVAKLAARADSVRIEVQESRVLFDMGSVQVGCPLVEGQYPDYEAVIPTEPKTAVRFDRAMLREAFQVVNVVAREGNYTVRLELVDSREAGLLAQVMAMAQTVGDGCREVPLALEHGGEAMTVAVNGRYMDKALKLLGEEAVLVELTSPMLPLVIRPVDYELEGELVYVVMPMSMNGN